MMPAPAPGAASFQPDEAVLLAHRPGRFRIIAAPLRGALPYAWVRRDGWATAHQPDLFRVPTALLSPAPPEE